MGKKSRKQRPTNPVIPRPTTRHRNRLFSPSDQWATIIDGGTFTPIPSSDTPPKPTTLAEAKAELKAAVAAFARRRRAGGIANWILDDRFKNAVEALSTFVRIESAATREIGAKDYLDDYLGSTVPFLTEPEEVYKVMMRWPRYQKYWPRLRRRLCWCCGKQYDLSEPRLWVCCGCGQARYCDEACQRAHWPDHQGTEGCRGSSGCL